MVYSDFMGFHSDFMGFYGDLVEFYNDFIGFIVISWDMNGIYHLVMSKYLLNMTIEMVDVPMENGDF